MSSQNSNQGRIMRNYRIAQLNGFRGVRRARSKSTALHPIFADILATLGLISR